MVTVVDNEPGGWTWRLQLSYQAGRADRLAVLVEKHRVARSSTITDANAVPFAYVADGKAGRKIAGTKVSRTRRN